MFLESKRRPEAVSEPTVPGLALPWIVRLRYGMVAGEIAVIIAARFGLGMTVSLAVVIVPIVLQVLTNLSLPLWLRGRPATAEHGVGLLFCLDTLCLTAVLGLTGGAANPFSLLYLVQITFSAVILHRAWTWALGILSTIAFGSLFWISSDLPALHVHVEPGEFSLHLLGMWVAFAAAALLISFFIGKVSLEARQKEQEMLAMQRRLARNERLASLVTLAAGAAHEISTPLSTIAVIAKELEHDAIKRLADPSVEEDARLIRSQVERCRQILERMGAQGADPFGETPRPLALDALLARVCERFPSETARIQVQANGLPCVLPENAAVEAISALVKNALDASSPGLHVDLRASSTPEKVRFTVMDSGVGMDPATLDRVLEPFFTTKPAGKGMGLGAFLVHLFAQRLGGQLTYESSPGRGCTAVLELPVLAHVQR